MDPLKPLGRALSQTPFSELNATAATPADSASPDLAPPPAPGGKVAVSVFDWISLFRAIWRFMLRPIFYLVFKLPLEILKQSARTQEEEDEHQRSVWYQRQEEELMRKYR